MDLVIALSQGLGLAVAAGFFASAPLAVGSSVAALGFADGALDIADDATTVAVLWAVAIVEFIADAIWPGAEAGAKLLRRVVGGGLAFELIAGNEIPYVGLAIGTQGAEADSAELHWPPYVVSCPPLGRKRAEGQTTKLHTRQILISKSL